MFWVVPTARIGCPSPSRRTTPDVRVQTWLPERLTKRCSKENSRPDRMASSSAAVATKRSSGWIELVGVGHARRQPEPEHRLDVRVVVDRLRLEIQLPREHAGGPRRHPEPLDRLAQPILGGLAAGDLDESQDDAVNPLV